MIKGWKNNPDWRRYFESRNENDEHNAMMKRAVEAQETNLREQRELRAKQEQHMRECHADKVASGEIPDKARTQ